MAVSLDTLDTGNIHERADVGRQLSRLGTPDQIPRLLVAAREDPSPGVRLYAICAAADILSRHRVGESAAVVGVQRREELLGLLRGIDPAANAGVFSVLACLGLPHAARRILVGLRDPRLDVRTGATVGAWRYFASIAAMDDRELRAEVVALLDDPRVRPDALARLARLCARCGWQEARPALERQLGRDDQVAEAAAQALGWLDEAVDLEGLEGAWVSDGVDACEIRPEPGERRVRVFSAQGFAELAPGGVRFVAATRGADRLGLVGGGELPLRRMVLPAPGTERDVAALQLEGRTWYRLGVAELAEALEPALDAPGLAQLPAESVDTLLAALEDGAGRRVAARVELAVGRPEAAAHRLEEALAGKRPSAELWFWLGEAMAALDRTDAARAAWAEFVERGPRRSPLMALAQQRLGVS